MSDQPHVVIRADASPVIGGGHVMRCLALAASLCDEQWNVTFATCREAPVTVPPLQKTSHGLMVMTKPDNPAEMIAALPGGCDLMVVDHYGLDRKFEAACRPWAKQILAIDDLADRDHDCELLLDQTHGRSASAYAGRVGHDCRMLLGSGYALLRPAFPEARWGKVVRDGVRRVLVAMGTSDAGRNLVPIIGAISKVGLELDIAVGSSAPDLDAIKSAAARAGATLHIDAANMARLMADADLAVLAAGTTTWEAACVGLPMILLVTAGNQEGVAATMASANAAAVARTPAEVAAHVMKLVEDNALRRSLASHALAVCDGLGARRVAIALRPEHVAGGAIELRSAVREDGDLMLGWQRDPATRRFARNPVIPTADEHRQWLDRKLSDPRCIFNLILCNDGPAGVLRLDRSEPGGAFEISILTASEHQRRGIASAALRLARRLVPRARLLAEVIAGNVGSLRLFERAGFHSIGNGWLAHEPALSSAAVA